MVIFSAIIFLVFSIIYFSLKIKVSNNIKKRNDYLNTLDRFEIQLDSIKIDGFHWQENIPVDVYDNELDPNSSSFYGGANYFSVKNKFHKNKVTTKFKTKIYITLNYRDSDFEFNLNLPIEHTNVRMKFYMKKKMIIYVDKIEDDYSTENFRFLFDFRFLNTEGISIVSTNFFKPV